MEIQHIKISSCQALKRCRTRNAVWTRSGMCTGVKKYTESDNIAYFICRIPIKLAFQSLNVISISKLTFTGSLSTLSSSSTRCFPKQPHFLSRPITGLLRFLSSHHSINLILILFIYSHLRVTISKISTSMQPKNNNSRWYTAHNKGDQPTKTRFGYNCLPKDIVHISKE